MSDFDISQFIEEGSLTEVDEWYDDPEGLTPNKERTEPKQNLQTIPELVDEWTNLEDESARLSPENQDYVREKGKSPFYTEIDTPDLEDRIDDIVDEAKRHLQAKKDPQRTVSKLASSFDREAIEAAAPRLKDEVFSEAGLIGNVYIDADLYPDCQNGEGRKEIKAHAKDADYVKAKSACEDCVHNKNGYCDVFDKKIVEEVPYDEAMWEQHARKLHARGKTCSVDADADPKEKIRQAYLRAETASSQNESLKPTHDPTGGIDPEEAWEIIREADASREVLEDPTPRRKIKEVGRKMCLGYHEGLKDRIASDPDLAPLRPHFNLLGRAYVASEFYDEQLEEELLRKRPMMAGKPVVSITDPSHIKDPEVIDEIVNRAAITNGIHPDRQPDKFASLKKRLSGRLQSLDNDTLRRIAKQLFSEPVQGKRHEYEGTERVERPEDDITTREAIEELREASNQTEVPDYAVWIQEGGDELLHTMQDRFGKSVVQMIDRVAKGHGSKVSDTKLKQAKRHILADDFQPRGTQPPAPSHFETKVGKKLNETLVEGKTGEDVARELEANFTDQQLLEHLPVITAFRDQEGLYGHVYATAKGFEDCRRGSKSVDPEVDQIVKADKCSGCVYNNTDTCQLYQKNLADQPQYTDRLAKEYVRKAIREGRLTKKEGNQLLNSDLSNRETVRASNLAATTFKAQTVSGHDGRPEGTFSAYRDSPSEPQTDQPSYQQTKEIIKAAKSKLKEGYYGEDLLHILKGHFGEHMLVEAFDDVSKALSEIDEEWHDGKKGSKSIRSPIEATDSTEADDELSTMEDYGLKQDHANNPMGDLDLSTSEDDTIDVDIHGGFSF